MTLAEAIERCVAAKAAAGWKPASCSSFRGFLRGFSKGREDMPLASITRQTIEDWCAQRTATCASVHSYRSGLSVFFNWCLAQGLVKDKPTVGAKMEASPLIPKAISPSSFNASGV